MGRSTLHILKIVDPETLRLSLEAALKQILGEMDAVIQQQATGIDAVAMAILSLPAGPQQSLASDVFAGSRPRPTCSSTSAARSNGWPTVSAWLADDLD